MLALPLALAIAGVAHHWLGERYVTTDDAFVRAAGAANTLSHAQAGWNGANTDGYGLAMALREQLGVQLAGAQVILLGAGGASRGAAVECLHSKCAALWIGNRTPDTLTALLGELRPLAGRAALQGFDLAKPPATLPANAIVINATSLGLQSTDPSPIDLEKIPRPTAVYDMIYRPPQTALLRQAATLHIPHANGLSMLIHQGARSLEIWTGSKVPVSVMQAAAAAALSSS